jgi:hypothetical protein
MAPKTPRYSDKTDEEQREAAKKLEQSLKTPQNTGKSPKNNPEDEEELDEDDEETDETSAKNGASQTETNADEDEDDDADEDEDEGDLRSDIRRAFDDAGLDADKDAMYTIQKKNKFTGKWDHIQTLSDMPDLNTIGTNWRGGDYRVRAKSSKGKYIKTKGFSVSIDSFPETTDKKDVTTPIQISTGSNTGLEAMIKGLQEQNTSLLNNMISIITRPAPPPVAPQSAKDRMEEMMIMVEFMKKMVPEQPKIDYNKVLEEQTKMQMDMFRKGIELQQRMIDQKNNENVPDVMADMFKDLAGKLPTIIDVFMANKAQGVGQSVPVQVDPSKPAQIAPTQPQNSNAALIQILTDYFNEIILAYESMMYIHPYVLAEKACKLPKYAVIKGIMPKVTDEQVLTMLKNNGYIHYVEDQEFSDYLKTVLDCIRRFDIITVDDEDNIVLKEVPDASIPGQPDGSTDTSEQPPAADTGTIEVNK